MQWWSRHVGERFAKNDLELKDAHFFFMFLKEQGPSWDILLSTEKPSAHDSDKYISQFERCRFDCDVSIMQK